MEIVDIAPGWKRESDMIGISTDRRGIRTAEFLDRFADDKLKAGVIMQNREPVDSACFR